MRLVFKVFFGLAAVFLSLVLVAVLSGFLLPREHAVARRVHLKADPGKVWALVTDHARDPAWRGQLKATLRLADRRGHPVWQDQFANGQKVTYETTLQEDGRRLVREIVDPRFFGGTWTYELRPEGTGTVLTITEDGWVSVPFRTAARFVFGYASTLELYLGDLVRRLGESAQPEPA